MTDQMTKAIRDCQAFSDAWRKWADEQTPSRYCQEHNFMRVMLADFSLLESWKRKTFIVLYRKCPKCSAKEKKRINPLSAVHRPYRAPYPDA